jgi:hypothetical protein
MWAHAFEVAAALAVASSVRAICRLLLGLATLRVLRELAWKALAEASNRDHVAETFGSLIAVQGRDGDGPVQVPPAGAGHHHTDASADSSASAVGSIPRRAG